MPSVTVFIDTTGNPVLPSSSDCVGSLTFSENETALLERILQCAVNLESDTTTTRLALEEGEGLLVGPLVRCGATRLVQGRLEMTEQGRRATALANKSHRL
jgi:hypothetical protein